MDREKKERGKNRPCRVGKHKQHGGAGGLKEGIFQKATGGKEDTVTGAETTKLRGKRGYKREGETVRFSK